jgi:predicted  nucleic acid-binding Zn-ribbon protein
LEREHSKPVAGLPQSRQSENENELTVQIRYRDVEKTFSGTAESVRLSLNRFFNEFLPSFEVAQRLTLNIDLQKLAKDCEGIVAFAKEGPYLLVPRNMLTDNETLSLLLLQSYLAHQLTNAETDEVSKEELQNKLGKDAKIASTRLGELVKNQTAAKTRDEKYKITTLGLMQMQKDIIPRIKAKMGN